MHILDKIAAHKALEVAAQKKQVEVARLRDSSHYYRPTLSATMRLKDTRDPGIIAEHKRRSPSRPAIHLESDVEAVAIGYQKAGAAAMSVLTDQHFFGGSLADLAQARASVALPLLRKDFVIDDYQVVEARAHGADLILLISELLDKYQVADLAAHAQELGMEVLLEMHDIKHLSKSARYIDIVGVNNRDLTTFETDIQRSLDIAAQLPADLIRISESGLKTVAEIVTLRKAGFHGFLIGETFMKTKEPGQACADLIDRIHQQEKSL